MTDRRGSLGGAVPFEHRADPAAPECASLNARITRVHPSARTEHPSVHDGIRRDPTATYTGTKLGRGDTAKGSLYITPRPNLANVRRMRR
jgi:hypothetical protein